MRRTLTNPLKLRATVEPLLGPADGFFHIISSEFARLFVVVAAAAAAAVVVVVIVAAVAGGGGRSETETSRRR